MAISEAQIAEASLWLDQHAAAAQKIQDAAQQAAKSTWFSFEAWYSAAAVAAVANEMSQLSTASQNMIVGTAQHYIANVVAALRGTKVTIPRTTLPPVRGASSPLSLVHTRPAEAYRKAVATGHAHDEALTLAAERGVNLQTGDLNLAERIGQHSLMGELGITQYRRVVRPELSKGGSCGLCIAASDRIYSIEELLPMHGNCKCKTMPIIGEDDPGIRLNKDDLKRLYKDAGGKGDPTTDPKALKRTRYVVNEHGEYGPVIAKEGDNFRGPSQVRLEDDPARAARMLAKTLPILKRMEAEGAKPGPLQYQRDLVAKLTAIVGS